MYPRFLRRSCLSRSKRGLLGATLLPSILSSRNSRLTPSIYMRSPDCGTCLCQGEILSGLIRIRLDLAKYGESETSIVEVTHPYALVLSQACDLSQDFRSRCDGKPEQLPEVLFCQVHTAEELKDSGGLNTGLWSRVKINRDERYHFLEKVPAECDSRGEGLPELGVDFKRYFTLPTAEVYRRLEGGQTLRRTALCTPYLEHLSSRFAYFLSRVGLPREHVSE